MNIKDKELAKYVGNKIREYRKKKRLTQKELGKLINKKDNTISNYETGTISPEQDALFELAKALDVRLDDFFPALGSPDSLEETLINSNDKLDISDMAFLKQLVNQIETSEDSDRKELMDNIKLAVDFFNKRNKR